MYRGSEGYRVITAMGLNGLTSDGTTERWRCTNAVSALLALVPTVLLQAKSHHIPVVSLIHVLPSTLSCFCFSLTLTSVTGGRFKKEIVVDGQSYLLLIRDEGGPPEAQVRSLLYSFLDLLTGISFLLLINTAMHCTAVVFVLLIYFFSVLFMSVFCFSFRSVCYVGGCCNLCLQLGG